MSDAYDPSGAMTHLITHFRSRGISADSLESMHPQVRTHYAKSAGLNVPTDEGWRAVIDRMRQGSPRAKTGNMSSMQDTSEIS